MNFKKISLLIVLLLIADQALKIWIKTHMTLDEALRISPQLRTMVESDERIKKLVDTARGLEGMPRNTSTHAAGVVITANPVSDYVPLARNDAVQHVIHAHRPAADQLI